MAERIEYWGRLKAKQLTKEEELAAWERGDKEALLMSQIPFVCKVANQVAREQGFGDRDLCVAAGMERLWQCLDKFDPKYGRLTTWCSRPVRWAVQNAIKVDIGKLSLNYEVMSAETTQFGVFDGEPQFLRDILPADEDADVEDLRECIDGLPAKERRFTQTYLKAGSVNKASRVLGMRPNDGGELMQRVKQKIRNFLTA